MLLHTNIIYRVFLEQSEKFLSYNFNILKLTSVYIEILIFNAYIGRNFRIELHNHQVHIHGILPIVTYNTH